MFNIELKRIIKQKWIWVMIALCLLISVGMSFYMKLELPNNFNEKVYLYYMTELEGEFTQEKYIWAMNEYNRMTDLIQHESDYRLKYFSGEISEEEYKEINKDVNSAKYRLATMEYIVNKSEYLKNQYDNGIRVSYFNDLTAMDYMLNYRILFVVLVTSVLMACFIALEDRMYNLHMLIDSSCYGRKKLRIVRMCVYSVVSIFIEITALWIEYFIKVKYLNLYGLDFLAGSIMGVKCCELLSIKKYLIIRAVKITGFSTAAGNLLFLFKKSSMC